MAIDFDLNSFITNNRDFSRGYTFYITTTHGVNDLQKRLVRSSQLPASTVTPTEVNWQGNAYKLGTTQEFSDFTVSYSVDINDDLRRTFEVWMTDIHQVGAVGGGFANQHGDPATYMQHIELEHLSHTTGAPIMKYKLWYAWPSMVGEMSLDHASKEVATFDVTFTYQWHEVTQ